MADPIGLTMPFARTRASPGALASSTTQLEATLYNLRSLLLTNWGERPSHFYLGGNLIEFVFAPSDEETRERVVQRVEQQVAQWLPYVLLNSVDVSFSEGSHAIMVSVDFGIRGKQDLSSVLEVVVSAGA